MLIIEDHLVQEVLSMRDCIDAMELAFSDLANGSAVNHPRQRYKVPADLHAPGYFANIIPGAIPRLGVAALRTDSVISREQVVDGVRRLEFEYPDGRSWGFVLLYSLETGRPLAIIHDFTMSGIRVGATNGAALRALSRKDSKVVGLYGSGNEAGRNLEAVCCVRDIRLCKVFSPNPTHRNNFAREMGEKLGIEIQAVDAPAKVVQGSDIVLCMTNSGEPLFDGKLLVPGQTVVTVVNSDQMHRRSEVDETTFIRSDLIGINSRSTAVNNNQRELLDLIDDKRISWDKVVELGEVLAGKRPGRTRPDQLIYFKPNTGVGIQFAAAGAIVYEACRKLKKGRELPDEWFGADVKGWLDKGFSPSP